LLRGKPSAEELDLAAAITARYSDAEGDEVAVYCQKDPGAFTKEIPVRPLDQEDLTKLRI